MLVDHDLPLVEEIDRLAPKKRNAAPERMAQVQVISYLRRALPDGNIVFAIENERQSKSSGPYAQARFQMARRASGVLSGVPDLCCIVPGHPVVWIEMKAPKRGTLSDTQREMHRKLVAAGQIVGVARSIEDAAAIMDRAGIPLRFRLSGGA